jgi:hypothetical protein
MPSLYVQLCEDQSNRGKDIAVQMREFKKAEC